MRGFALTASQMDVVKAAAHRAAFVGVDESETRVCAQVDFGHQLIRMRVESCERSLVHSAYGFANPGKQLDVYLCDSAGRLSGVVSFDASVRSFRAWCKAVAKKPSGKPKVFEPVGRES